MRGSSKDDGSTRALDDRHGRHGLGTQARLEGRNVGSKVAWRKGHELVLTGRRCVGQLGRRHRLEVDGRRARLVGLGHEAEGSERLRGDADKVDAVGMVGLEQEGARGVGDRRVDRDAVREGDEGVGVRGHDALVRALAVREALGNVEEAVGVGDRGGDVDHDGARRHVASTDAIARDRDRAAIDARVLGQQQTGREVGRVRAALERDGVVVAGIEQQLLRHDRRAGAGEGDVDPVVARENEALVERRRERAVQDVRRQERAINQHVDVRSARVRVQERHLRQGRSDIDLSMSAATKQRQHHNERSHESKDSGFGCGHHYELRAAV